MGYWKNMDSLATFKEDFGFWTATTTEITQFDDVSLFNQIPIQ